MKITPYILGRGRSGQALMKSLLSLSAIQPELGIQPPVQLARTTPLKSARTESDAAILCIAHPHGLHADAILEAEQAQNFDAILCEKPACVTLEEAHKLRGIKTPTAILHVYRQTWGVQTLKSLLDQGQLGQLVSIEGRYWTASAAERALTAAHSTSAPGGPGLPGWKDDPRLSGEYDTYLDLGTHWVDAASFLMGKAPSRVDGWRSYVNGGSSHRDTHVQLVLEFPNGGRAFGSVSKNLHGATNQFEITLIGSKASASWEFLKPDEIVIGEGRDRRVLTRKTSDFGSRQPAFHGLGWLEGYIEISSRLLTEVYLGKKANYPDLKSHLDVLEAMLQVSWKSDAQTVR